MARRIQNNSSMGNIGNLIGITLIIVGIISIISTILKAFETGNINDLLTWFFSHFSFLTITIEVIPGIIISIAITASGIVISVKRR